jgi:protein gp37
MSTKIEWTDETWNPVTGCTKVSQGCKNCYAERLAPRVFAGQMYSPPGETVPTRPRVFTDVLCHPERLDAPLHWKKPRRVFVNSMSDLFHEDVPDEFIGNVFSTMGNCDDQDRGHTFQILTKRPERMLIYMKEHARDAWNGPRMNCSAFPPRNVWLGVSVEDQATADERIPLLLQTPAAVRFISYEPALGPINLGWYLGRFDPMQGATTPNLHWLIAGGESGPNARPSHPDWFRAVRDQCAAAGVPFFFKQWGEWLGAEQDGAPGDGRHVQHVNASDHSIKVGKKAAGRLLDGKLYDAYPGTAHAARSTQHAAQ